MLLDDDVVTNGQAQSSPFTGRFCRKERVEQLLLHLRGIPAPSKSELDFDAVAEALGRRSQRRLVVASIRLGAQKYVRALNRTPKPVISTPPTIEIIN